MFKLGSGAFPALVLVLCTLAPAEVSAQECEDCPTSSSCYDNGAGGPFWGGFADVSLFQDLCEANSMVRLRVTVWGDFGGYSKYISVRMNNVLLNNTNSWMSCNEQCSAVPSPADGRFLRTWGTSSCSGSSVIHIYVEAAAWNNALHLDPLDDMQINLTRALRARRSAVGMTV